MTTVAESCVGNSLPEAKVKVCIWMNHPSSYQTAFFDELSGHSGVELQVRYFEPVPDERRREGWRAPDSLPCYAKYVEESEPAAVIDGVDGAASYIHLIGEGFDWELVRELNRRQYRWYGWTEAPGIALLQIARGNLATFRALAPVHLLVKRIKNGRDRGLAHGAFVQGKLARMAAARIGYPSSRIYDLYYSPSAVPDSAPDSKVVDFARGRLVVLFVGALSRRKGVDILLSAFEGLDPKKVCLVVCGADKSAGRLIQTATSLTRTEAALFLGPQPPDRLPSVYSAANILVLPSRFDGWGAVLNEGASAGCALIGSTMCGGSWHLIEEGVNGFRVAAGSSLALRGAIEKYTETPGLAEEHGRASMHLFHREFSPAANVLRFLRVIASQD